MEISWNAGAILPTVLTAISAAALAYATHKSKVADMARKESERLISLLTSSRDAWKEKTEYVEKQRADSDKRHEEVLREYREKVAAYGGELQSYISALGDSKAQVAELTARTDFKPVWDFQQEAFKAQQDWFRECSVVHQRTLDTLVIIAPLLVRVSDALGITHPNGAILIPENLVKANGLAKPGGA